MFLNNENIYASKGYIIIDPNYGFSSFRRQTIIGGNV